MTATIREGWSKGDTDFRLGFEIEKKSDDEDRDRIINSVGEEAEEKISKMIRNEED